MYKSSSIKSLDGRWGDDLIFFWKCMVIITDDDFVETSIFESKVHYGLSNEVSAIIKCYSERNLNVAKNLFLFIKYHENSMSLKVQINFYKKDIKEFSQYISQIEKYVLLQ